MTPEQKLEKLKQYLEGRIKTTREYLTWATFGEDEAKIELAVLTELLGEFNKGNSDAG